MRGAGPTPILSENFEGFDLGQLAPQGGWSSQFDANAVVTDINPISGTRSARHISDGTSVPGLEIRSPQFDAGFEPVTSTVSISSTGSTYDIAPRGLDFGLFNTRVRFDRDGMVRVGEPEVGKFGDVSFDFIDTGFNWLVDTDYRVSIQIFSDGGLTVGINGSEIFSGMETTFEVFGIAGQIQEFNIFAGNEGVGSADGTGDTLTLDNVLVGIPAPGAAALFGLGGLAATRRRR